jgi:hypothetical protein
VIRNEHRIAVQPSMKREAVFVTSANLTEATLERNIEVGLLVRDCALAASESGAIESGFGQALCQGQSLRPGCRRRPEDDEGRRPRPARSRGCQEEAGGVEELRRVEAGPKPWPPKFRQDVLPRICTSTVTAKNEVDNSKIYFSAILIRRPT